MIKKYGFLSLGVLIVILCILFLGHKKTAPSSDPQITVLLDWYISVDQAPLLLAQARGYFAQQQITVKLVELSDASEAPKLLVRHHADIAISYGGSYFARLKKTVPVQRVGTLINHPLNCLVYVPRSGIQQPQDLKNKRLGYSDPNDDFGLLTAVLRAGGLTLADVTLINIQNTLIQPLLLGKIDVAVDMLRNIEPIVMEHHGVTPGLFCPEDFGLAPYSELIYIAPFGPVPNKITRFLAAINQATRYLQQHPDDAWQQLKIIYPKFNTEIQTTIWQQTYPLFAPDARATRP